MKNSLKSRNFIAESKNKWSVVWFVPNLIGYARILLLITSYFYKDRNFGIFASLYFASFALDFFDGPCARMLHQTSRFGGMLDMLTDRMGTLMLYIVNFELMAKAPFWCAMRNKFSNLDGDLTRGKVHFCRAP